MFVVVFLEDVAQDPSIAVVGVHEGGQHLEAEGRREQLAAPPPLVARAREEPILEDTVSSIVVLPLVEDRLTVENNLNKQADNI